MPIIKKLPLTWVPPQLQEEPIVLPVMLSQVLLEGFTLQAAEWDELLLRGLSSHFVYTDVKYNLEML